MADDSPGGSLKDSNDKLIKELLAERKAFLAKNPELQPLQKEIDRAAK